MLLFNTTIRPEQLAHYASNYDARYLRKKGDKIVVSMRFCVDAVKELKLDPQRLQPYPDMALCA